MKPEDRDRESDLDALATVFIMTLERSDREYGSWGQDDKRPFGNSGYYQIGQDILAESDIIDYDDFSTLSEEEQEEWLEYAHKLYDDLGDHLKKRWATGVALIREMKKMSESM